MKTISEKSNTKTTSGTVFCTSDKRTFTDEQCAYNHALFLKDDNVITLLRNEISGTGKRRAVNKK